MSSRQFLLDMAITVPVTFLVAVVVTYLYNLVAHGMGAVDWDAAFELALVVGIVLPLAQARSRNSG